MRHLFDNWKSIQQKIKKSSLVFLVLDYDGTLTPIVSRPELAKLKNDVRKILVSLSKSTKFKIGIISGRRLNKIEKLVKIKNIFYAGNHGFEIKGPRVGFIHPACFYFRPFIKKIKEQLNKKMGGIKGVVVEDKHLTLSIHYRLVNSRNVNKVKRIFKKVTTSYIKNRDIRITQGKKVFEVRPPVDWNKGKALEMIVQFTKQKLRPLKIYLGDDTTDEDVFKILDKKDISVFVGDKKRSKARYFLKDTKEVKDFLSRLKGIDDN